MSRFEETETSPLDHRWNLRVVLRRHPQQFRDNGGRQGQRVGGDQFRPAPALRFALHGVEEFLAERLDASPQPLDEAGGERLRDERAQPRVVRVVQVEHVALQRLEETRDPRRLRPLLRVHGVQLVLGESVVLQHPGHVLVAGHQPRRPPVAQRRAPHGGLGAQARVERVGVRLEGRAGEIGRDDFARCRPR